MSVNLVKGQKVDLKKGNGGTLRKVVVGLGWDEAKPQKKGLFSSLLGGGGGDPIDCDAAAFLCVNGRIAAKSDVVFFGNLTHKSGAVRHMGDNLTGAGDGDDEQIMVDLESVPAAYDKIIFVVNIYLAMERKQHFGMIQNAFIRVFDQETNQELCKYLLSDNYQSMTSLVFDRSGDTGQFNRSSCRKISVR